MNENLIASVISMLIQEVDVSNFKELLLMIFFKLDLLFLLVQKLFL